MTDEPKSDNLSMPKKRNKRRKALAIICTTVVVLIGVGTGFFVWHATPDFCNAICHSPMDTYVEGYYSQDSSLLVTAHAQNDLTCLSCHETTVEQQIAELQQWVSGDFRDPMLKRGMDNGFCLREGCHDLTTDELSASTSALSFNPHDWSFHEVSNCGGCHSVHGQSTLTCTSCHGTAEDLAQDLGWKLR
jgi:hypothetical protein